MAAGAVLLAFFGLTAHAMASEFKPANPAAIVLQGGSDSNVQWKAPSTDAYKVHVFVPKTGSVTNALYHVYPQGKRAGSTECLSADVKFPCYEASVDQTQHQNAWVQLTLNDDMASQWDFVKGKGMVAAIASNLGTAELLNLAGLRFENRTIAIGKSFEGGLIFYIDDTGKHGLLAAPTDQSKGIQWYNGSYLVTGATATAVGSGQANTAKIISVQGAGAYAAQLTADLVLGGYGDWFLPSMGELNLMYKNIGQGAAAQLTNVRGFAGSYYWSSSKYDYDYVWLQQFGRGPQYGNLSKSGTLPVRAVRAF